MSNDFKNYLKENGIKHNTSIPNCTQSNGRSERLNRTLLEKARFMIISAKLDNSMCTAAVYIAYY